MSKTSIEWTDHSINPIRARLGENTGHHCQKISPGCKNCYSSRFQPRFRMPQFQEQRAEQMPEVFLHTPALEEVLRRRTPTRFFWCDMTDIFGEWVSNEMIAACFGVMAATPQHTHQVLTKRIARALKWYTWIEKALPSCHVLGAARGVRWYAWERAGQTQQAWGKTVSPSWSGDMPAWGWPLPNVHVGVSVENQQYADERIPLLMQIPAALRFLSVEPMIGPIDLRPYLAHCDASRISWVIVGGESGRNARPFDIAWARSIVAQCRPVGAPGVPCFVKQLGDNPVGLQSVITASKGGDPSEWPADLRVRQLPGAPR